MEELLYLLPQDFIESLSQLEKNYLIATGLKTLDAPPPYKIATLFGATDIANRAPSIRFINRITKALNSKFTANVLPLSPEDLQLMSVLISVCLYEKHKIEKNYWILSSNGSDLVKLIDEALGIKPDNYIDTLTRFTLLQKSKEYIDGNRFTEINNALYSLYGDNSQAISLEEWNAFKAFVINEHTKLTDTLFTYHYPAADILSNASSRVGEIAGISVGWVLGDMIGKSRPLMPLKYNIATWLGALMFALKFPNPMGTVFVIPSLVGAAVDVAGGVSMAYMTGKTFKAVGYYAGYSVGFIIDTSGHGIQIVIDSVKAYMRPTNLTKSGVNLESGEFYYEGEKIDPNDFGSQFAFMPGTKINISSEGNVSINGSQVNIAEQDKLKAKILELTEELASCQNSASLTESSEHSSQNDSFDETSSTTSCGLN